MNQFNGVPLENKQYYSQLNELDFRDVKSKCRQYHNYHVIAQMSDGSKVDGIIEDMDDDGVTMLMPEEIDVENERQFGDYNDFGGYGGYGGYGRRRFRRYRRRRFPYSYFAFPFFFPFPYYYPYR